MHLQQIVISPQLQVRRMVRKQGNTVKFSPGGTLISFSKTDLLLVLY